MQLHERVRQKERERICNKTLSQCWYQLVRLLLKYSGPKEFLIERLIKHFRVHQEDIVEKYLYLLVDS